LECGLQASCGQKFQTRLINKPTKHIPYLHHSFLDFGNHAEHIKTRKDTSIAEASSNVVISSKSCKTVPSRLIGIRTEPPFLTHSVAHEHT
jgi:hypothetical protein